MVTRPRNLPQADPYFDSVVLLCPLSGEHGDTTTTDLSNEGHTMTFAANASLDSSIRKFGFTSCLIDNTDGKGVYTPTSAAWANLKIADGFTVEAHVNYSVTGTNTLVSMWSWTQGSSTRSWGIFLGSDGGVDVWTQNSASSATHSFGSATGLLTADTWHHVVFQCQPAGNFEVFVDGTRVVNIAPSISELRDPTDDFCIGATDDSVDELDGYVENVRITKGVARYTDGFTPPERAYSTTRTFATVPRGSLENPALPDISELSLDSTNLLPVESTGSLGAVWNDDGTQVWIPDANWTSDVYTTSTAYDASSLTHATSEQIGDISIQRAGRVATDGTLLYLQDYNSTRCNSYTLSTAYDFSSLTFNQTRADQLDMQDHMSAFDFASEGDYYFGWDLDTGEMLRYDMSTPYDLSSGPGTTPSQRESMDGITTQDLSGLIVSVDGLTMWGLIQGGTEIWQWTLNTAYDLTGGTTKSGTFTLNSTASSNPYGMFSPKDRNEIWICWNTNPRIESYVW